MQAPGDISGLVAECTADSGSIVSTTNNNQTMNASTRRVASRYLDGRRLTEALLNQVEVAIRAYDPCLSCATHAMGKMPLVLTPVDCDGNLVDRLHKRASGEVCVPGG
jgi:NAD-reducing hydrogenase large subunit